MPSRSLPARTVEHAARVWPLVVVPLVATLLEWGRVLTLLNNTDRVFSVSFGFPRPVATLWAFVNAQPTGVSGGPPSAAALPLFVVGLAISAVVAGVLAAGYLGSIDAAVDGQWDFVAAVRQYALPLVGFSLLEAVVGILLVLAGLVAPPLLVAVGLSLLVFGYLFFATPYLVVVEELALGPALGRAFELATGDARVPAFFLGYAAVSALLSVPVSWVAFNVPVAGVAVAVLASAPLALLLNVATLLFVRELVGVEAGAEPVAET